MQKYILGTIIIIGLSVGGYIFLEKDNTSKPITQGISGKVQLRSGNCMPKIVTENPPEDSNPCELTPVARTIYIRQATKGISAFQNNSLPDLGPLVKKTSSNKLGEYLVELPPGNYSVFVEDNGKEHCGITNREGIACGVIVQNGITTYNPVINHAFD